MLKLFRVHICLLLAISSASHAQLSELEETVVTATRVQESLLTSSRSISVIGEAQIQTATQQLGIDEVLANVPGLFIQGRYNFSQDLRVSLRGFGARSSFGIRGVRIYVDEVPESLPDGQAQVDSIDLGSAERIEVLRGPASSLYGNASGGVISVTSQKGAAPTRLQSNIALGELGYGRYQVKLTGKAGAVDYLVNVSRTELDGYREHGESRSNLFNGRFNIALGDADTLSIVANVTDQPKAQDAGGINQAQVDLDRRSARDRNVSFNAGEELFQTRLGFAYKRERDDANLLVRGYLVNRDFDNFLPFEGGGSVNLERLYTGAGVQYTRRLGERLNVSLGFDIDRQDDERRRFDNVMGVRGDLALDQNEQVTSLGGYGELRFSPTEDWLLRAGVRLDEVRFDVTDEFAVDGVDSGEVEFSEFSPSAGVTRSLGDGHHLFASIGRSFETPTTTEFANPSGAGGFNQDLNSQVSLASELGIRGVYQRFRYEAVIFNIDLEDELIPFELAAMPGRTFFSNAGESNRQGLELAASWSSDIGLGAQVSFTSTNFEFDRFVDDGGSDFSGNILPGLPERYGYVNISYKTETGFSALFESIFAGSLFANNSNSVEVDSYTISNLRLARAFEFDHVVLEPYLGINNLFGEKYNNNIRINAFGSRFFEPAPERNSYLGLRLSYQFDN